MSPDEFPRRFGRYVLLEPLARGGMGALYLAYQGEPGMEKLCVVKTVLKELADKEYVARFRDEAKVVVRLSHGNLVPVFDAGSVSGELYIAMDHVDGRDLRAVWNQCARCAIAFPIDVAVFVVKELARGLYHAHGAGELSVVHRDVSPPNVLLAYSGEVKLTDFGLASSTLKLERTAPGVIYGKVSYMAPEQARGEPLDGRADLYAAGVILWELLTGRQLVPTGDGDALERVRAPQTPRPSTRASRVPPELDALVMKALAPACEDRYQGGEEMRAQLAAWLAKEAPTVDHATVATFLRKLWGDEIERERRRREALIEDARKRLARSEVTRLEGPELLARDAAGRDRGRIARVGALDETAAPDGRFDNRLDGRLDDRLDDRLADRDDARLDPRDDDDDDVPSAGPDDERSARVIGQLLDGRYRVHRLIGEGGMGRVYEAEHVEIGKRVAIKVLHPAFSRFAEVVARFRREARAASRIGHPNIVDVTDSGTTATGAVYFVMEYLEGCDLADVIQRERALDVSRAVDITVQLARALEAAHQANVIHRDLKPENVFLVARAGQGEFVKVLDFGIARNLEMELASPKLTKPNVAMGTPEYMAPEQAMGRPADARSDIYAAGAILFEMLTGQSPHPGENAMEVLSRKHEVPPSVRSLRDDVPEALSDLVARVLARDPARRPQTMALLADELDRARPDRRRGESGGERRRDPSSASEAAGAPTVALLAPRLPAPAPVPARAERSPSPSRSPAPASARARRPAARTANPLGLVAGGLALVVAAGGVVLWQKPRKVEAAAERGASAMTERASNKTERTAPPVGSAAGTASNKVDHLSSPADPAVGPSPAPAGRRADAASATGDGGRAPSPARAKPLGPAAIGSVELKHALDEGFRLLDQHALAPAAHDFSRCLDAGYMKASALTGLARVAFDEKRYGDSVSLGERALKAGGGADTRLWLGKAYFKSGRFADAATQFRAVVKARPTNDEARRLLDAAGKHGA